MITREILYFVGGPPEGGTRRERVARTNSSHLRALITTMLHGRAVVYYDYCCCHIKLVNSIPTIIKENYLIRQLVSVHE